MDNNTKSRKNFKDYERNFYFSHNNTIQENSDNLEGDIILPMIDIKTRNKYAELYGFSRYI